jgi:hypothetical protein
MPDCELLAGCAFFNDVMPNMPETADRMKVRFCRTEHRSCARFLVFEALGRAAVPATLFPNQSERALALIDSTRK